MKFCSADLDRDYPPAPETRLLRHSPTATCWVVDGVSGLARAPAVPLDAVQVTAQLVVAVTGLVLDLPVRSASDFQT